MNTDRRETKLFEQEPVPVAIAHLALPTIVGQIILVIYNMADTFFIGLTGSDAKLASVAVCLPAFMFLSAIDHIERALVFDDLGGSVVSQSRLSTPAT